MKAVRQPRALATREKILRAAARLFALQGYHATTLEEVRDAAALTTGAFFHHFSCKEDLGFAVLERHMQRRRRQLDEIENELPPIDGDDALQHVFRRLDAIAEYVRRREHRRGGCIVGNFSTALADTHEPFRRRLAACFDAMAQEFEPYLREAAKQHFAPSGADPATLAAYIVAVVEGAILLSRTFRDRALVDRQFACLKDYLKCQLAP
ncbi:MAG: TetR family transcriptional regulator C-terminal domain-containing protein [Planctomycetaceae bacterium]